MRTIAFRTSMLGSLLFMETTVRVPLKLSKSIWLKDYSCGLPGAKHPVSPSSNGVSKRYFYSALLYVQQVLQYFDGYIGVPPVSENTRFSTCVGKLPIFGKV